MDRRRFLFNSGKFLTLPFLVGGQAIHAWGMPFIPWEGRSEKKLILVQLDGGSDGLNTLFPLDQFDNLAKVRSEIIIPENKLLKITEKNALHPAMAEIRALHDAGKVLFIQNVGYPQPNLSHFRSKEIILSGSDSGQVISSGWFGRYLSGLYPDYPLNYPNSTDPHPLAISVGNISSPVCQGHKTQMGVVIKNLATSYISGQDPEVYPDSYYGEELEYIAGIMQSTEKYLQAIDQAASAGQNRTSLYPDAGMNKLADQLKIVSRLMSGGLQTPVYTVSLGGFDTHANQCETDAPETGNHANLLGTLSVAINAFQDDLRLLGLEDDVIGLVYTEFGRRIKSNKSNGTDHGEAFPAIVFGSRVNPVVWGSNPVISSSVGTSDNLPWQTDFRSIYNSILKFWFEVGQSERSSILFGDFGEIPILKSAVGSSIPENNSQLKILSISPNPVRQHALLSIRSPQGYVTVRMVMLNGHVSSNLFSGYLQEGRHTLSLHLKSISPGTYLIIVEHQGFKDSMPVVVQ